MEITQKIKIALVYEQSNPLPIYIQKNWNQDFQVIPTLIFIAALFTISKT
jgi:hypothetical protein